MTLPIPGRPPTFDSLTLQGQVDYLFKVIDVIARNTQTLSGRSITSRNITTRSVYTTALAPGGTYQFGLGSAASPSVMCNEETDSGLYWTATGDGSVGSVNVTVDGIKDASFTAGVFSVFDITGNEDFKINAAGDSWYNGTGNFGIGTTAPGRTLDVAKIGEPQLRLNATGGYFVDLECDSNSDLVITPAAGLGTTMTLTGGDAATNYTIEVENTNAVSTSGGARFYLQVDSAGGDPYMVYDILGGSNWIMGADNSDSDKFKISTGALSGFAGTKGLIITSGIYTTFNPAVATSGTAYAVDISGAINTGGTNGLFRVLAAASTGQTASTEINFVHFDLGATTTWATGALTNERAIYIEAPTLAFASASTVTHAATVYIDRAPQAGTNATITAPYAIWVDAGNVRLDGELHVYNTTDGTNYERGVMRWSSNILEIGTEEGGTGSPRDVKFIMYNGLVSTRWYFGLSTHNLWSVGGDNIRPEATNTYDIGTSSKLVHDIWVGSTLFLGTNANNEAHSDTVLRLTNAKYISGRNAADTDDIGIIGLDASNFIVIGSELTSSTTKVIPGVDASIDFGSTSLKWATGYFTAIDTASLTNSGLTSGRVIIAGASGILTDDSGLTYSTANDALTVSGWLNNGTSVNAVAAGDFDTGLTTSHYMFYDQSAATLKLHSQAASNIFIMNSSNVQVRDIRFNTGDSLRWILRIDSTAESGSNVGSDFRLIRRTDAGADNGVAFFIKRSSGFTAIGNSGAPTQFLDVVGGGCVVQGAVATGTGATGVVFGKASAVPTNEVPTHILWLDSGTGYAAGALGLMPRSSTAAPIVMLTGTTTPVERLQIKDTGEAVWNDGGNDYDLRVETDDEPYCLMVEGTLNNVVFCAATEPAFQSMDGGLFLATANVVPTGNPTAGIYIYVESGAGKARGTGGTITTWAPAEPHCPKCGYDYIHEWENPGYEQNYLAVCMKCLTDEIGDRPWILRKKAA